MRKLIRPALLAAARFGLLFSVVMWIVGQSWDVYSHGEVTGKTFVYMVYRRATGACLYTNEQFGWGGWIRSNRGIEYVDGSDATPASETSFTLILASRLLFFRSKMSWARSSIEYISWCGGGEISPTPGVECLTRPIHSSTL